MSSTIEQSITNYNKIIDNALEQLEWVLSQYVCAEPELLRQDYQTTTRIIDTKTNEINERRHYINECINNLEKCKNSMAKMENVLEEIGKSSNAGLVGTLHGICKGLIKTNKIPMNEIEETVFNFPYDEKTEIQKFRESIAKIDVTESYNTIGGKNIISKRNNTKRKNI
jgi:hypothetical protein